MRLNPAWKDRAAGALYPLFLVLLNLWICGRLFRTEYLDQFQSIEGAFIALARYIQRHHPGYDWFSMWNAGMPFARTYQPALHYTVATVAQIFGLSSASAYHAVVAITYSLGAATMYYLGRALSGDRAIAMWCGLMFSLVSPSALFAPAVRRDVGGFLNARRLQALVVYGEGPNVTGLMLAMLALALLHRAMAKRTPFSCLLASLAIAGVAATSWPGTVALLPGIFCLVAAHRWREVQQQLPRLLVVAAGGCAFALPFALPSTIRTAFHDANSMPDAPTPGAARWISLVMLLATMAAVRAVLIRRRTSPAVNFAALYLILTAWIVLEAEWTGIRLIPYPARFHLAMEIAMVLAAGLAIQFLWHRKPAWRWPVLIVTILFCFPQAIHYRRYARTIIRAADIEKTLEYQEAQWFDRNMHGGGVVLPGTLSFWVNVFTETPEMKGCCLQSLTNLEKAHADYMIAAGYRNNEESAYYSILWMKAYAVQAIAIGGARSREYYKDFQFPYRFQGKLPLAWNSGDDFIYLVPERAPGLARVVRETDLVKNPPADGADITELRPFVSALDDPALPLASFEWQGANAARVKGRLESGSAVEIAMNYDPGWTVRVNGRSVPVQKDGLGLMFIRPRCDGDCELRLQWSPGLEPWISIMLAVAALTGYLFWCFGIAAFGERLAQGPRTATPLSRSDSKGAA